MSIILDVKRIVQLLFCVAITLILMNIIMLGIYFYIDDSKIFDFVQMVDLDQEANLPTLFSSMLLLVSAFLFYLLHKISKKEKNKESLFWLGLSFIFTFLAFDESAKIHETIGDLSEKFVDHTGYLYYPWVISYIFIVLVLGIFYMRFFWKMESKLFWSFMGAAALFLSGAIGFELLGAKEASLHGSDTLTYCVYYTIEESLEMFGVIYLINILLKLLKGNTLKVQ